MKTSPISELADALQALSTARDGFDEFDPNPEAVRAAEDRARTALAAAIADLD